VQSESYFNLLIQAGGKATVSDFTFGGTAACDWLPAMRTFARTHHPDAVVIEFIGNTDTPCMFGCAVGSRTSLHSYCSAISQAIQSFLAVGTHVYLAGTPITKKQWANHDRTWDALNRAFSALAAQHPKRVTYIDAGISIEGPHHSFVSTLPCMYFEPCNGPTVAGVKTDVVRSPDGVHFCPATSANGRAQASRCVIYSSGAFRFAAAMTGPLIRELHLAGSGSRSESPAQLDNGSLGQR
jgi:hypothetical protein